MNGTDVSSAVLERISGGWDALTPEVRKAARYVLENPQAVGVSTVREIAEFARVKPGTFVRMARAIGFEGYEDFREPFRAAIRDGLVPFHGRARWLQAQAVKGGTGTLYADMVGSALRNIEETFADIPVERFGAAAEMIRSSRQVFTVGVGVNSANARNFTYLASTGMERFHAIPRTGSDALDDLAGADGRDALVAITWHPYRSEVIAAVEAARKQGLRVVGISDSPASPVIRGSDHRFVVAIDTPQFFPSSVSTIAVLETLLSFVVANASPCVARRVESFHARRHELGIYAEDPS